MAALVGDGRDEKVRKQSHCKIEAKGGQQLKGALNIARS
jgi:hypothetical protein